MKTYYLNQLNEPLDGSVVTVGFFDGVHVGHQYLLAQLNSLARQHGLQSTVVTFARHPRQVLDDTWQPQLLTTFEEKTLLLCQAGIDNLVVLDFDRQMAALTARQFMEMLNSRVGAKVLLTGYDNRFGHNRSEGFSDYVNYGRELGITVEQYTPKTVEGLPVSSSMTRAFLQDGEIELANRCLGRPYTLSGRVVQGEHIGRQLGYPTANIDIDNPYILVPAAGVYGVSVIIDNDADHQWGGMMNIGTRPTFDGSMQTLEIHLFHFDGNLYNRQLSVAFWFRQRGEQKFGSKEKLASQLHSDARQIEEKLKKLKH